MARRKNTERELYEVVRRWLAGRKYLVFGSAGGGSFPLPLVVQDADLIGFKWRGSGVDTWGIEVKRGDSRSAIRSALAQAVAYQVVVPRVSIATQATRRALAEISGGLGGLGIGAIRIGGRTRFQLPRAEAVRAEPYGAAHVRPLYEASLRHAALLALLSQDRSIQRLFPDAQWRAHASVWPRGDVRTNRSSGSLSEWGFAVHPVHVDGDRASAVQLMLHRSRESGGDAELSVWVEKKDAVKRVLRHATVDDVRSRLPTCAFRGRIARRVNRRAGGGLRPKSTILFDRRRGSIRDALNRGRKYARGKNLRPCVGVTVRLWRADEVLRRGPAERRLRCAVEELRPTLDYLRDCTTRRRFSG